jgi:uncharacterized integral membrane protein
MRQSNVADFYFLKMENFLSQLKVVASSPLALIAYLVLVVGWVIVALAKGRLEVVKNLPEDQRADVLAKEYSHKPRSGLSAEQWIRSRVHLYIWSAFIATLIATIIIIVTALARTDNGSEIKNVEPSPSLVPTPSKTGTPSITPTHSIRPTPMRPLPTPSVSTKPVGSVSTDSQLWSAVKSYVYHSYPVGASIRNVEKQGAADCSSGLTDCRQRVKVDIEDSGNKIRSETKTIRCQRFKGKLQCGE